MIMNTHSNGYEKYNDTKCVIGEFKKIDSDTKIYWIDAKKGTVLKVVEKGKDESLNEYEKTYEYSVTYNKTSKEDVQKPDLNELVKVEKID